MTLDPKAMQAVATDQAPAAIGPYSQAIKAGGMVYCSGQIALAPGGSDLVGEDVATQARQVFTNLQHVLEAAGSSFGKVVKTTVYLASMDDFPVVNEIYAGCFGEHRPARATVAARTLPKGALVEIDAVALA